MVSTFAILLPRFRGLPFALGVEVNPTHCPPHLIETDVVKAFEACARDGAHAMIWYQEVLLPSHENVFSVCEVFLHEIWSLCLPGQWPPGREAVPMLHIDLLVRAPFGMARVERIFSSDDFAFKVCCKGRMFVRKTFPRTLLAA